MQELKKESACKSENNDIKVKEEINIQDNANSLDKENKEEDERKDVKDITQDEASELEDLDFSEKDSEDKKNVLKYDLSSDYFIEIQRYFQNFIKMKSISQFFHSYLTFYKIPYEKNFLNTIKNNDMLYQLFLESIKKIGKSEKINILKNGLFYYKKKLLFYCRKDERIEDNYLADIKNIECIDYKEYDKIDISENKEKNIEDKFAKSEEIRGNNSSSYKNKSENIFKNKKYKFSCQSSNKKRQKSNKITGLKNRALGLESLVHFYFKELKLISLPDIIFNISYKAPKENDDINLYYEWDGCFFNKNEKDLKNVIISPFHKENKFIIENNSLKDYNINKDGFKIQKDSFIFLEVKTHFPKTKETDENQNLENLIKTIFNKLNHYIDLYSNSLKFQHINNIYIILLYNQHRIINYESSISEHIKRYKNNFNSIGNYIIYFDIFYIFPSIGKLSLNYINKKLKKNYKNLEDKNNKAQNDIKEANEKIKKLEEQNLKAQNDANAKIKNLEEQNLKAQNDANKKIKILEEQNLKTQNDANEKIKNLEEQNLKAQNDANEKIQKLERQIKQLTSIVELLNMNIPDDLKNSLQLKTESSKNNNNVWENNYKDKEAQRIKQKMNNHNELCDFEKIYYEIFMECYKKLNRKDFSLLDFKENHVTDKDLKKEFHAILSRLTKDERKIFFEKYEFTPCMSECPPLIDL